MPGEVSGDELVDALLSPVEPDFAGDVTLVTAPVERRSADDCRCAAARLATLPTVVVAGPGVAVAVGADRDERSGLADLLDLAVTDDAELAAVIDAVERTPNAAMALAVLLRGSDSRTVGEGLAVESATFSALQAGPEHQAWLAGRAERPRRSADDDPRVRAALDAGTLAITLARPRVRNALDVAMRDELLELLTVAEADPALRVELRGDGRSFCAGGDLDAFGSAPDPATAHVVRLRCSIGAVLDRLGPRATAFVHGPTAGSGVELAAFCGRLVAHPDATFVLPELSLGLVPGAGGTVSLPRRIGRHRTAWLAFTGRTIDAPTALAWNLADEIRLF